MTAGLVRAGASRRRKYEDLTLKHFGSKRKEDGRLLTWYWDDKGKSRNIYLYQWIWEQHYKRRIPKGMVVHHKDLNPLNNKISNLQLMTNSDHTKLHWAIWKRERATKKLA